MTDDRDNHPSAEPFSDETIRVWCCQTKVTGPHKPDCTFQPTDGSILRENAETYELFLRDLRHILNAHGWDNRLNVADNLLAEWVLGELQGLVWVTHSASLTPSPQPIPFSKRLLDPVIQGLPAKRPITGSEPPATLEHTAPPNAGIPAVSPAVMDAARRLVQDAGFTPNENIVPSGWVPSGLCTCGGRLLMAGQNVAVIGTMRHRRNDPCYGIGIEEPVAIPCKCGAVSRLRWDKGAPFVSGGDKRHSPDNCELWSAEIPDA